MAASKPIPDLNIPASQHTVSVSIIDTSLRISGLPMAAFMQPDMPGLSTIEGGVSYSFLIKHNQQSSSGKLDTILFDLGARKDIWNSPKAIVEQGTSAGIQMEIKKNVYDILKEAGDDPDKIGAIIWSHFHSDHTGDPSTFPTSTDLIVGPGFKQAFIPGWPTNEYGLVDEKAWEGRELREIAFDGDGSLMLGQYKAYDFYGDGSLYLIDSPGHATGHMCALARTSADPPEFVLLGGDVAHHGCEFRPSEYIPLPETIEPNPLVPPFAKSTFACPGEIFEAIHPKKSSTEPFTQPLGFIQEDTKMACASVEKLLDFDAQENVFSVIAHDWTLLDVVDFYPNTINDWKTKGWKQQGHWRFLRDFDTGKEEYKPT